MEQEPAKVYKQMIIEKCSRAENKFPICGVCKFKGSEVCKDCVNSVLPSAFIHEMIDLNFWNNTLYYQLDAIKLLKLLDRK